MRPDRLVVVTGTGTEVGKTWVAARLATVLGAAGVRVAARKPAQSHEPGDQVTDADALAAATGEDPFTVCPAHRRYAVPMAPPMAAEVLGAPPIRLDDLVAEVSGSWPDGPIEVGLVELAGGVRSPTAGDGDGVDLCRALSPDVVLVVADAGLGTVNSVRLTVDALDGIAPLVVHLNRYDDGVDLHRRNLEWLVDRCGLPVTTEPTDLGARISPGAS